MARTVINVQLNSTGPVTYTVPALKVAVFTASLQSNLAGSLPNVSIDGVIQSAFAGTFGGGTGIGSPMVKPLVAGAGMVVSVAAGSGVITINGFSYDA